MIRSILLSAGFIAMLLGCEPVPSVEELNQNLLVQTDYDETTDFKSYTTYTLPIDTLGLISNSVSDTLLLGEYASSITAKIKTNMDSRGYAYVDKNQTPDLGVSAFIVNDFNVFQTITYPNYAGGYYSPYYGYYYPTVNTFVSNSGVLIVQLVDLNKKNQQNQFQVVWTCYIGDVIASVDPFARSIEAVDQAFVQTPLLGK